MAALNKHTATQTPAPPVKPPSQQPTTPPVVDTGGPTRPPMLSREQYVKVNHDIFSGTIKVSPYNDLPYFLLREKAGTSNRSKEIDALILRQGGDFGNAYCQFGQQDKMDAVAMYLKIPRKHWNYPEGGGTQRVFSLVDSKYKFDKPLPGMFWTVQYNHGDKGHIEDVYDFRDGVAYTLAFNTTIDGDDTIVRDGQGAGFATRPVFKEKHQGKDIVTTKGFVDHYLIYCDAYKKFYNV